jgi:hypothetical protein
MYPTPTRTHVIKIATLNINGIPAPTKVGMFSEFIRHEIHKLFVQEVINPETLNIGGFETHHNFRTSMPIPIFHKLPSGRAKSAEYSGIRLTKVNAPSGSARRTEREDLFNTEVPVFFYTALHPHDSWTTFCVLNPADTTGSFLPSRILSEIVRRLALVVTWNQDPLRPTFTHHFPTGATRLERFYESPDLVHRKPTWKSYQRRLFITTL